MAETLIFEEQITLTPLEINGATIPYYEIAPPSFTLEVGQNYRVVLDTSEFSVTAYDMGGSAVIGNAALGNVVFGDGVDTGEPFVIAYTLANGEDVMNDSIIFVVNNGNTSPTVAIYHIEGEPDGIVIRDPLGKVVTYGDYKKIRINKSSGEKVIYSEGEAVEDVEIALDFSDGDQTITATDGTLVKSAVIAMPSNLISENIVKGVDIAGVVGTHECSGGGIGNFDASDTNLKYFYYRLNSENQTIILTQLLYDVLYSDTGSYDVIIPDKMGGYDVIIALDGVI